MSFNQADFVESDADGDKITITSSFNGYLTATIGSSDGKDEGIVVLTAEQKRQLIHWLGAGRTREDFVAVDSDGDKVTFVAWDDGDLTVTCTATCTASAYTREGKVVLLEPFQKMRLNAWLKASPTGCDYAPAASQPIQLSQPIGPSLSKEDIESIVDRKVDRKVAEVVRMVSLEFANALQSMANDLRGS